MGALGQFLRTLEDGWGFYCPGCRSMHYVNTGWAFNGSAESPTFSPSVLVRTGHYDPNNNGRCWCSYNEKQRAARLPETRFRCEVCHSFVTDGKIHYLSDCTHHLAGKTVPMVPCGSWWGA